MGRLATCEADWPLCGISEGGMGQTVRHPLLVAAADLHRVLLQQLQALALPLPDEDPAHPVDPGAGRVTPRWQRAGT